MSNKPPVTPATLDALEPGYLKALGAPDIVNSEVCVAMRKRLANDWKSRAYPMALRRAVLTGYCMGLPELEICQRLNIQPSVLAYMRALSRSFAKVWYDIRDARDEVLVASCEAVLEKRALGLYEHKAVVKGRRRAVLLPPDRRALQFILANRARDRWGKTADDNLAALNITVSNAPVAPAVKGRVVGGS